MCLKLLKEMNCEEYSIMPEKGLEMRSLRPIEVESVFGDIKSNYGVRRFLLKGIEKMEFNEVWDQARQKDATMRMGAYMVVIDRT